MFPVFLIFFCVITGSNAIFEFTSNIGLCRASPHLSFMLVLSSLVLWHLFDFRTTDLPAITTTSLINHLWLQGEFGSWHVGGGMVSVILA